MISYLENKKIWILETDYCGLSLGLSPDGFLVNTHFGAKLPYNSDYPEAVQGNGWASFVSPAERAKEEFPAWSLGKISEPSLKASFGGSIRDIQLTYESFIMEDNHLRILLRDAAASLSVTLHYLVHSAYDIFERWVELENTGTESILVEQCLSGAVYLPDCTEYRLTYLTGKWLGETQIRRTQVPEGKFQLESRTGTSSHLANPFVALDKDALAAEESGVVYAAGLAYSGNWKISIEKDVWKRTKISAGIHDFDFQWRLEAATSFCCPKLVLVYSQNGFGELSRKLHRFQRQCVAPDLFSNREKPILYNSWEATEFDVHEQQQKKLADIAAELGVELFVMDDGWFGQRNSDRAGLGDWFCSPQKFPEGLEPLVTHVNKLGMDFGLWVEPEMVNPDSDLYRKHPEWAYSFPRRENMEMRNQLVLNLARKDVQEYIFQFMDRLLSENNIRFIKWDMNRSFSEAGWTEDPDRQREIWYRHTYALYNIVSRLRNRHPSVLFQCCSGGGGRIDLGVLPYFDQFWTSDNTDAFDRLRIQEGFSLFYAPKFMEAWVTAKDNFVNHRQLPLSYRFHSAMQGVLGIGDDISQWSEKEKKEAQAYILQYKQIRQLVQEGDLYRLASPSNGILCANQYVSADKSEAVVFCFVNHRQFQNEIPKLKLAGLHDKALYFVDSLDAPLSGKALQEIGVDVQGNADYVSSLIHIRRVQCEH